MLSALGLALMQASGNRQPVVEGTPAKAIYAAFPNYGGVLSALLSQRGLEAGCAVFEGEAGFFPTFYHGRYDRSALVDAWVRSTTRWRWASSRGRPRTGTPIHRGRAQLAASHPWDAIDEVHIRGGNYIRTFCEPRPCASGRGRRGGRG